MPTHTAMTVGEFMQRVPSSLALRVVAGESGLAARAITSARIQKLGLALAGFSDYIRAGRVQIVGRSEVNFLNQLTPEKRREALSNLALERIACVLLTSSLSPPIEFIEAAARSDLPLLQTPLISSAAIFTVTEFLQDALALYETRHGVLLDIHGLGVLIEGQSGIGKSECALDLIMRGHALVADDVVEVRRPKQDLLVGRAPAELRELMEIRGLGIINIRKVCGVAAVSDAKRIDLAIRLERWGAAGDVERLGLEPRTVEILGVKVPHVLLPVSGGRNIATLVETAVRLHLLLLRGEDAARDFLAKYDERLSRAASEN